MTKTAAKYATYAAAPQLLVGKLCLAHPEQCAAVGSMAATAAGQPELVPLIGVASNVAKTYKSNAGGRKSNRKNKLTKKRRGGIFGLDKHGSAYNECKRSDNRERKQLYRDYCHIESMRTKPNCEDIASCSRKNKRTFHM